MSKNSDISTDTNGKEDLALGFEQFLTLGAVSEALNVPLFAVRRAAKNGTFPSYKVGNGRVRVRLSEVIAAIERS
jgi:excisionase family DNA binding protein